MADVKVLLERQAQFFPVDGVARIDPRELRDALRIYDYAFACMLCGYCLSVAKQAENYDAVDNWTEVWIRLVEDFHKGIR